MEYTIKERTSTEATVQVTVSPKAVREQIEAVYLRYAKEIRVPGFRKGRVPRNFLDSRFGAETFLEEAQDDLQRRFLPEALMAEALRPVSTPTLNVVSFGEADSFVFDATFAVLPEVELPDYPGMKVEVPANPPITDEDVQRTLEEIQTQFGTLGEKDGSDVADGDIVRVKEGEQEWDTRADADNPVMKHLIGAAVGSDVDIDTELPDGKEFKTTLHVVGLREIVLPEIDDELAKDAGFDDLDMLRTDIRTKLTEQRAERYEQLVDGLVLEALVEKTEIPLPDAFVDELVDDEVERIKESIERNDSSMSYEEYLERRETTEETLRGEIRESVERRARRELTVQAAAKALEISIGEEELGELAKAEAETVGEEPLRFVARLKAEERWDDYRSSKVNERVFAALREAVDLQEKENVDS